MLRLHSVIGRGGLRTKYCAFTASYFNRYYSQQTPTADDDCKKKQVSCLSEAPPAKQKCRKKEEDICQQGTMKVPPLPAECKSTSATPVVYDSSCMRPYVSPCQIKGTCKSDMMPQPCIAPCERKAKVCLAEPDCAFERRIDWGLRIRQLLLAVGAIVGGLILWHMYGQEVKVEVYSYKKDRRFTRPMEVHKIPETSQEIPSQVDYLLIGGGAAAYAAQKAIRALDKKSKVLIICEGPPFQPSMRPPLSNWLWKEQDREKALGLTFKGWDRKYHSLNFESDSYYTPVPSLQDQENGGVSVAQGWAISKLNPLRRHATLTDGKRITYDKCLLATGGRPKVVHPFTETELDVLEKVTFYRHSFDFQELEELIQEGLKCIAVVGGGLLGTEIAAALKERTKEDGTKIINVVKDGGNMKKILPTYLAKKITETLKHRGVTVLTDTIVEDVARDGSVIKLYVTGDKCVTADHVVVATGLQPNVDLATDSCIEIDPVNGGFLVNAEMQSSTGLWAAGDCASYYDCNLGRRREEHHNYALATGKIAGENMTGKANRMVLEPTFWSSLSPDFEIEGTGIVDARLPSVGIFPKSLPSIQEPEEDEDDEPEADLGHPSALSNTSTFDRVESDSEADSLEVTLATQPLDRGVVYYLNDKQEIVGVLTINLPGKISIGQTLVKQKKTYDDINEVTKEFDLHNAPAPKKIRKKHKKGKKAKTKQLA